MVSSRERPPDFPENYNVLTGKREVPVPPGSDTACCVWDECNGELECDGEGFWADYCRGDIGKGGWASVNGPLGMEFPATGACKHKENDWPPASP